MGGLLTRGRRAGACGGREHGWDRERFLEEVCAKAGLEPDAWKQGATLEAFTAFVFSEATCAEPLPAKPRE